MTDRLYYTDATLRRFGATVRSCDAADGRARIVLDRTAFYPTSGGQPFDRGQLGGVEVLEVVDDEAGEVVHVTAGPLAVGAEIEGEVAWARRVDHMQQHTGQHVLSAAFERAMGARTVSFHMGADVSTIDLAREVTPAEIARAESDANGVVWDDRALVVRVVDAEEAARLPLRKETVRIGAVRLVEVPDWDLSACGGTHVSRTGEVGLIAVTAWERFKGGTRLAFVCGGRALESHRRLRDTVASAARRLGVAGADITSAMERLAAEASVRQAQLAEMAAELTGYRAAERRSAAETIGQVRVVLSVESTADAAGLKALAQAIVAGATRIIVVLVGDGQPAPVVVARSADLAFDAGAFIKQATTALGGRGGGRSDLAQAGLAAEATDVLVYARQTIAAVDTVISP